MVLVLCHFGRCAFGSVIMPISVNLKNYQLCAVASLVLRIVAFCDDDGSMVVLALTAMRALGTGTISSITISSF
jgi:hypothetical protein